MREISKEELTEILAKHAEFMADKDGGERANLSGANLSGSYLSEANLSGANLSGKNLLGERPVNEVQP